MLRKRHDIQFKGERLGPHRSAALTEPDTTKTVLWNGNMLFSYTGVSALPRPLRVHRERSPGLSRQWPTITWLSELLTVVRDEEEVAEVLREEASRALGSSGLPVEQRGHAFIGVGWSFGQPTHPVRPIWVEVTNLSPGPEFVTRSGVLADDADPMVRSSRPGDDDLISTLLVEIAADPGPAGAGRALVAALREVAEHDDTVGRDVLLTCLPHTQMDRMASTGRWSMSNREPDLDHVVFRYLPAGVHDGVARGPAAVLGGNVRVFSPLGGESDRVPGVSPDLIVA